MKSIIIIGNYGKNNKVDGQIMKTRTIYNSVKKKYYPNYKIEKIDTSNKSIILYMKAFIKILNAYRIIILPAYSALKPLLILINLLGASKRTIHIAIGGWLDQYINKTCWKRLENNLKVILVELKSLKKSLEKEGLTNVVYFPNYRQETGEILNIKPKADLYKKFVFYARIIPEKGILEAIDAINILNKGEGRYTLDIYGPLEEKFKDEFLSKIKIIPNISYNGILKQGDVLTILNKYDALLFPTYYNGEGFPGTILESYMAGLPVIASDWKYNKEIIEDGKTGIICEAKNVDSIVKAVLEINNNIEKYKYMPINCKQIATMYTEEKITKILFKVLSIE